LFVRCASAAGGQLESLTAGKQLASQWLAHHFALIRCAFARPLRKTRPRPGHGHRALVHFEVTREFVD
jgi:hypothetical protein